MSLAQRAEKYTAQPPEHGFDFVISHRSILQQDRVSVSEPSGGEIGSKGMEEWSQDVREQSGECHHTQRVSGVKVVGQFVGEGNLYREQRAWGASSCFLRFPDDGLEKREQEGGWREEVEAGWRWRWGGEGQRGGCRAKGCDDDNTEWCTDTLTAT